MHSSILVDIGNTNTKWTFEGDYFILPTVNFEFDKLPSCPKKIWVSNVSLKSFDPGENHIVLVESQESYKSMVNAYSDPISLGSDRWLGMIASYEITQGKSFIFLDIGTAITIDVVSKSGTHQGGLIFPGIEKLRQTFDNFPVSSTCCINELGRSTEEAWSNGTISLLVNTINHKIGKIKEEMSDVSIFITGGGYSCIQNFIDFDHVYNENLVLDGLELYVNNMG